MSILKKFEKDLKRTGVETVYSEEKSLKFKNGIFSLFSRGNLSIWAGILNGKVEIIKNPTQRIIQYSVNLSVFFIIGLFVSLALMKSFWLCIGVFLAFIFTSLLAVSIRHYFYFNGITSKILNNNHT
jgi:uncharacterized membrane protein